MPRSDTLDVDSGELNIGEINIGEIFIVESCIAEIGHHRGIVCMSDMGRVF